MLNQLINPVSFQTLGMTYPNIPQPLIDIPFSLDRIAVGSCIILMICLSFFAVSTGSWRKLPVSLITSALIAVSGTVFIWCMLILSEKVLWVKTIMQSQLQILYDICLFFGNVEFFFHFIFFFYQWFFRCSLSVNLLDICELLLLHKFLQNTTLCTYIF